MRIQEIKKLAAIIGMFAFLTGIVYVNLFAKKYMLSMGIFDEYFLEQYTQNIVNTTEYLWYVIKLRLLPIFLLALAGNTKFRRIAGAVFLLWTSFSAGIILTTAILRMGIKGLFLCLVAIIPHYVCYVVVYVMILIYLFSYPNGRWNKTKTISLLLFVLLGVITECYINPVLMDIYINML